jgi:hypothetical protein
VKLRNNKWQHQVWLHKSRGWCTTSHGRSQGVTIWCNWLPHELTQVHNSFALTFSNQLLQEPKLATCLHGRELGISFPLQLMCTFCLFSPNLQDSARRYVTHYLCNLQI